MKKPRSFVTFQDGHEEEIIYYETYGATGVLFVTKSGVYLERSYRIFKEAYYTPVNRTEFLRLSPIPNGIVETHCKPEFNYFTMPDIKSVTIDERIPYKFYVKGNGAYIFGDVLVPPDASEETIRKLIADQLNIEFERKE